jgi:hypothetical protein
VSITGSPPGAVGLQLLASMGFWPTKKNHFYHHKKNLIILQVRIDPKKKVRNSRRVRAHQSHENWNISLFRLE